MSFWGEGGALLASGSPVTIPRDPARDAARRELLDPAYHQHDPSVLQRITDWLSDRIDEFFRDSGPLTDDSSTALVLTIVAAALIVAAVWWRLGAPRRQARSAAALFEAAGPRTAADHRTAAAAHAAAGDWTEAVREQMRALVRALEERALLDVRPGRTADEAADEAGRALPGHADALRTAARTFDDVAYGERAADETAYRSLVQLDRDLAGTRPAVTTGGAA